MAIITSPGTSVAAIIGLSMGPSMASGDKLLQS